ncbi:hypothetical protein J4413_00600 [Candidatus Woesearchaeota archaeon]|nr:hypothetical protein [Candidatus Woesearchaeota archaeon]
MASAYPIFKCVSGEHSDDYALEEGRVLLINMDSGEQSILNMGHDGWQFDFEKESFVRQFCWSANLSEKTYYIWSYKINGDSKAAEDFSKNVHFGGSFLPDYMVRDDERNRHLNLDGSIDFEYIIRYTSRRNSDQINFSIYEPSTLYKKTDVTFYNLETNEILNVSFKEKDFVGFLFPVFNIYDTHGIKAKGSYGESATFRIENGVYYYNGKDSLQGYDPRVHNEGFRNLVYVPINKKLLGVETHKLNVISMSPTPDSMLSDGDNLVMTWISPSFEDSSFFKTEITLVYSYKFQWDTLLIAFTGALLAVLLEKVIETYYWGKIERFLSRTNRILKIIIGKNKP